MALDGWIVTTRKAENLKKVLKLTNYENPLASKGRRMAQGSWQAGAYCGRRVKECKKNEW